MILDDIVAYTKSRVAKEKIDQPIKNIINQIEARKNDEKFCFEEAIQRGSRESIAIICEVKKASPSKGILMEKFEPLTIAKEYEQAKASCISVLTEPKFFQGDKKYLKEISENVKIPTLRKDFIVDEYQIYEARMLKADCVLLICSILTQQQLILYKRLCDELQISALIEVHNEKEIDMAMKAEGRMIGVNNRNLEDFTVDIRNSIRLRKYIPKNVLMIAESGINCAAQVRELYDADVNGLLIGESLMKAKDKKEMLEELKSGLSNKR